MEVFILKSDKFLKSVDSLTITKEFKSEKRCIEYSLGRFLTKSLGKNFYNLQNVEILVENEKPKFKTGEIFFSISHSKNIVAVAFDTFDIGLDVEYIKPRNLDKLSKYLKQDFKTELEFYKYWTTYEAQYKSENKEVVSFEFDGYMFAISGKNSDINSLNFYEVYPDDEEINLSNPEVSKLKFEKRGIIAV